MYRPARHRGVRFSIESFDANTARVLLIGSHAKQIDLTDVLSAHGVDPKTLVGPDVQVPHDLLLALWQAAEERWGDSTLGFQLSRDVPLVRNLVTVNMVINSPTLRDGYQQWYRYGHLMHPSLQSFLSENSGVARGSLWMTQPTTHAWMEYLLGRLAALIRAATMNAAFEFTQITTCRPTAPDVQQMATAMFGAPVVMDADMYSLSFASDRLDEPLAFASPRLLEATIEQAEHVLATLNTPDAFIERVRRCVMACTRTAEPTVERVARELDMSPRSLQRKLKRSGTAFHTLRDETRLALAERYLADRQTSMAEVAFLLGFSEVSAFYRAFRRWTGTTPREYAQSLAT